MQGTGPHRGGQPEFGHDYDPDHLGSDEFLAAAISGCSGGASSPAPRRSKRFVNASMPAEAGNFKEVPSFWGMTIISSSASSSSLLSRALIPTPAHFPRQVAPCMYRGHTSLKMARFSSTASSSASISSRAARSSRPCTYSAAGGMMAFSSFIASSSSSSAQKPTSADHCANASSVNSRSSLSRASVIQLSASSPRSSIFSRSASIEAYSSPSSGGSPFLPAALQVCRLPESYPSK